VPLAILAEEQHPTDGRYFAPLVGGDEPEGLEVLAAQLAHRRQRLGSSSEVQDFRVETGHRPFVKGLAAGEPSELFDELTVGAPVGGADPDIDAVIQPLALQEVRAGGARIHLGGDDMGPAPRHDLEIRHDARDNVVADQAGETLLQVEWVGHAPHMSAPILYAQEQRPPGGVGEGHDRLQGAVPSA